MENRMLLRGLSICPIRDNEIRLPKHLAPDCLRGLDLHLVAPENSGFVMLIPRPAGPYFEALFKKELGDFNATCTDREYRYLGKTASDPRGCVPLTGRLLAFAGIRGREVRLVGAVDHIEVWDVRAWDEGLERAKVEGPLSDLMA